MHTESGTDTNLAAGFLKKGQLVAIPTETVYGLAGNALDEKVVLDIFKLKQRPSFDPLIVHIHSAAYLEKYVQSIPEKAIPLIENFWPGPLTILFEKKPVIPDLVTSGLNTVAIRVPVHPLTRDLLGKLDFPLAAPSANPFGYVSPTSAAHVSGHFDGKIPYILDGGACKVGIESTIVGFENDKCIVYRLGGLPVSEIERFTGKAEVNIYSSSNPLSPGMLKSHYAPSKKLIYGLPDFNDADFAGRKISVICLQNQFGKIPENFSVIELSPKGNLDEAAAALFAQMRAVDTGGSDLIIAIPFPEEGLGRAINDRLKRAAADK